MTCPNCGHKIPYQSVDERIAEWAEEYLELTPPEDRFIELRFHPIDKHNVVTVIHYWKNSDYKVRDLYHPPALITDTYEYKRAIEQAWETRP